MKAIPQTKVVPIDHLIFDEKNAAKHDEKNLAAIRASINRWGQVEDLVVQKNSMRVLGGNGRLTVMKELKYTTVSIKLVDLEDEEADALAIALNRAGELRTWNNAQLMENIQRIRDKDPIAALATGFAEKDMQILRNKLQGRAAEVPQRVDVDTPTHPVTQVGDVWIMDQQRLVCGDATDNESYAKLMPGEKANLIVTDPPYGVNYQGSPGSITGDDKTRDQLVSLLEPSFRLMASHSLDDAAFYVWHASSTRRDFEWAMEKAALEEIQYIVWIKDAFVMGRAHYHWQTEPCFYARKAGHQPEFFGGRAQSTVWRVTMEHEQGAAGVSVANGIGISDGKGNEIYIAKAAPKGKKARLVRIDEEGSVLVTTNQDTSDAWEVSHVRGGYEHPTQKPTELAARSIRNSCPPGGIVLDPFAGGGFTLLGAQREGRRSRCIELEPKFCDVIIRRWQTLSGRMAVHEGSGKDWVETRDARGIPA